MQTFACRTLTAAAVLLVAATLVPAFAEIPEMMSYQGKVTDAAGVPVADGTYDMRFRIYNAETGGSLAWDSGTRSVDVEGGVFNVYLGESPQPALHLPFDEDYWLLVTFDGVNQTPRQRLASVGYAYMASGLVPGTSVAGSVPELFGFAIRGINSATTYPGYGVVGRSDAPSGCGVAGEAVAATGEGNGVYGRSWSASGAGVYGEAPIYAVVGKTTSTGGTTYAGSFETASTAGRGIASYATATSGTTYGAYLRTYSTGGRGVYAWASATTGSTYGGRFRSSSSDGKGVCGEAVATTGLAYGGYFESASDQGTGVRAYATATGGVTYGVYGRTYSTTDDSRGVYGRATATTGMTYGVYGRSDSNTDSATGVYGYSSASGAITCGVYGKSDSWYGTGVQGSGPLAGVWGIATGGASGSGTGVFGEGPLCGAQFDDSNSSTSAAVASDTYKIVGTGSVSFVQNHPYDNERVIVYAAPEGDEVATYTRGTARLADGEARVALGETFKWVTNPDIGLTAHLTPRGNCKGLYVASLSTTEMVVRELGGGTSEVRFDYIVYGLRIGFEEQTIVQEKQKEARIPSMASHRERCNKDPALLQHTALERFRAMGAAVGETEPLDLRASHSLRDAIQEYDPAVHGSLGPSERFGGRGHVSPNPQRREERIRELDEDGALDGRSRAEVECTTNDLEDENRRAAR